MLTDLSFTDDIEPNFTTIKYTLPDDRDPLGRYFQNPLNSDEEDNADADDEGHDLSHDMDVDEEDLSDVEEQRNSFLGSLAQDAPVLPAKPISSIPNKTGLNAPQEHVSVTGWMLQFGPSSSLLKSERQNPKQRVMKNVGCQFIILVTI